MTTTLYDRWIEVAAAHRGELALRDIGSTRSWTFDQLRAAGEICNANGPGLVFPGGNTPQFIITLLGAWRSGKVACPLEPGQSPPAVPAPPNGCVHLKITSATTGTPRMVAFTADQLVADAENIIATMGLRPDWPNLGGISMAHSYGFSNLVLPLLLHGIPLILAPAPLPEMVRRAADGELALTLAAVPAMWSAWHEADAIPPTVRLGISAGAPLAVALEGAVFERSGLKLHNFYGSTECGGIAYDAGAAPRTEDSFVGTPMRNVALQAADDGRLTVRSRAVGETYWPEPEPSLGEGSFHTSDIVEFDNDRVYLRGRIGDQINVAGRKIAAQEVERALMRHPSIEDCLVFGIPDGRSTRTDVIVACVVAASPVGEDVCREFLLKTIPAWQVPRRWWFVESLSVNERGKISRAEWRNKFLATQSR